MFDDYTPSGTGLLALATVWGVVLSYLDCRERRLPNWLTMGGAAVVLVWRFGYGGLPLFVDGLAAAAVGGVFLLIPFLMRGAGGGDVKMLFAAGAAVGWGRVLVMLWVTSVAGVLVGLAMLIFGRLDGSRLKHYLRCAVDWRYDRKAGRAALPPKESERARVPFSIPITVGMLWALLAV